MLREVLADELERLTARDERLDLLTITSVDCDADYRTATVYFSSLEEREAAALSDVRVLLQAAVGRQARLKWTPLLRFAADPAVSHGLRVEEILRSLPPPVPEPDPGPETDPGLETS